MSTGDSRSKRSIAGTAGVGAVPKYGQHFMIKTLIALLLLSSCGVEVKGLRDVKVTHEVSVTAVIPYITAYCELGNHTPEDIQACVNVEIGKLLSKI